MKFKIPKKIIVVNLEFKIIQNKKSAGGGFDFSTNEIEVGTKYLNTDPQSVFEILVHEISEAIHCKFNTRYEARGNERDYLFAQDHKQFENHIAVLTGIIYNQILK